jgi:hypothetical protein
MKIILKDEKPMSLNKMYAGIHWSVRKLEAERVHYLVLAEVKKPQLFLHPVDITITAYFNKRVLDPDNIVGKLYIDGLKGLLITDDTYEYVRSVKTISAVDKQNPRVEIDIQ